MTDQPQNIYGWKGVDTTTDEFLLGKAAPDKSSLAYNYRAKNGIRVGRTGFTPVLDFASGEYPKKSGIHFPPGAHAILPHTSVDYTDSFYLASTETAQVTEYTVEFWYRAEYVAETRELFCVPCDFGSSKEKHMCFELVPSPANIQNKSSFKFYMITGDNASTETLTQQTYTASTYIPTDGEWHHLAIYKNPSGGNPYYILDDDDAVTMAGGSNGATARDDSWKNLHDTPHMYNYLRFGGDDVDLAEFRIWDVKRTATEISDNKDIELEGDEDNLVTYVPFNEGQNKYFTDVVSGDRGYFYPQEPFVNDDNELVFTGYNCFAFPSLRGRWDEPSGETKASHQHDSAEGAYDGGLLWDTVLQLDSGGYDPDGEGVHYGVAQMRIRLRQLKEGVLCGRLGMLYDKTEEAYRLFLYDETNAVTYVTEAVIDDDWVGAEKTITVVYTGNQASDEDVRCAFYIDDDDTNIAEPTPSAFDAWGDANDTALTDSEFEPYQDTADTDDTNGAIGGSPVQTDMCVAFDLIFFRHLWDEYPDENIADFLTNTYNTNILPDAYRYFIKGLSGYFYHNGATLYNEVFFEDISLAPGNAGLKFVRIPIHHQSSTYTMDNEDGTYLRITDDPTSGSDSVPKQDVMIRPILSWDNVNGDRFEILADGFTYDFAAPSLSPTTGSRLYFNGADLSNLVNDFNADTFKLNQVKRTVFYENSDTKAFVTDNEIHQTIEDDSPLQSIEKAGPSYLKTRYLILTVNSRHTTISGMRSLKARWCNGPISPSTLPAIRGIYRYTSEDGRIDRLLVAAWNAIWNLDPDNGTLTEQPMAWIDRNDDEIIRFLATNNMLLVMDSSLLLKLNSKGNWSRVGIETPTQIYIDGWDDTPGNVHNLNDHYAFVAQFYDSENNSYSGTMPIYDDEWQGMIVLDTDGVNFIEVIVRACKDKNIDRCLIWRTLDMTNTGTATDLYKVLDVTNPRYVSDEINFRDVWDDEKLVNRDYLSQIYVGQDLLPQPCQAIALGYNRVFLFNSEDEKSSLFWSDVDTLGFAKPDHFPSTYKMIVEEGDTTDGTALIEYSSQLFAFKENAIFLIEQTSQSGFTNRLIYKGVGAVNSRCVMVAGNMIMFLDRSGLYQYSGGEPTMLSADLIDFFTDEIDQDLMATKAFMLFDKVNDIVYCFVPSVGSSYCDRIVVFDMRAKAFTIDLIPYATCGYMDDDDLYIGTPYGQVLKSSNSLYFDGVSEEYSGSGYVL